MSERTIVENDRMTIISALHRAALILSRQRPLIQDFSLNVFRLKIAFKAIGLWGLNRKQ